RDAIRERHSRYPGLTRPELALAAAYTKIDLIRRLQTTVLVDDSYLVGRFLQPYFPPSLAEHLSPDASAHRLRHELIATRAVNELVDLVGSTFVFGLGRERGVAAEDVVRAWVIATDVLSIHERAAMLKRNAAPPAAESELGAFLALERASRIAAGWALSELEPATSIGAAVTRFKPAFEMLSGEFESMLAAGERDRFERLYRELRIDAIAGDPGIRVDESIEQLKRLRANRFAQLARLFDELKALASPSLPAIQVTIRALSRLAAATAAQY